MFDSWKQDLIWAAACVGAVALLALGCGGCVQKQSDDRREIIIEMTRAGKSPSDIQCVIETLRKN